MIIAADTHVHIYPEYRIDALLDAAHGNLRKAAPEADAFAICLTERAGHFAFASLRDGDVEPERWSVEDAADPHLLVLHARDGRRLQVLAGRQIVTAERLEVLALGADLVVDDGTPLDEVLPLVRDAGALPVLPWGLGKWWGARGARMRNLVRWAEPSAFALADTYLRPAGAPDSPILRAGRRRGLRILAGTDPLPRSGEEAIAGRYGVKITGAFDPAAPAASLVRLFAGPGAPLQFIGRRGSAVEMLTRR